MGDSRTAIAMAILALAASARADRRPEASVEVSESTMTLYDAASYGFDFHTVYRVNVSNPRPLVGTAFAFWKPWLDERPVIEATVTRSDGSKVKLDPATLSEASLPGNGATFTDTKILEGPLPGLAIGASVDERIHLRRHAESAFVSTSWPLAGSEPMARATVTIDAPANLALRWKVIDADVKPRREEKNGRVRLVFSYGPVPPIDLDTFPPKSPRILVSTAPSWQAVAAAWSARAEAQIDVEAVRVLAGDLTKGMTERDAKVKAILAWMAKNVRYTGLELGDSAWVPAKTSTVLARGFGDCKDLALLLLAFLRAARVDADIALLDPEAADDVVAEVPGLGFMRHAVVRLPGAQPIWLDPTVPMLAYGEMLGQEEGHKALIARPDTTGLVEIHGNVSARMEGRFDVYLPEQGWSKVRATIDSEGFLFSVAREKRAQGVDDYREWAESELRGHAQTREAVRVEASDPYAPGPLHETAEISGAHFGITTTGKDADCVLVLDRVEEALAFVKALDKVKGLDDRAAPLWFPWASKARVTTIIHAPAGYRAEKRPEDLKQTIGLVTVSVSTRLVDERTVEGILSVETARGTMTADEARRVVRELLPRIDDMNVRFTNKVIDAIDRSHPVEAVQAAREIFRSEPSPARRALLAAAYGAAGYPEAAAALARKAVSEAPDDIFVRNQASWALTFNLRGYSAGPSFAHDEVEKLAAGTLAKAPKDEWAWRLRLLAELDREHDPAAVAKEIAAYRNATQASGLDRRLVAARVEAGDWKTLEAECPGLEASVARDGACRAAAVVLHGSEVAFDDKTRPPGDVVARTILDLVSARRYDKLRELLATFKQRTSALAADPRVKLLESFETCRRKPGTAEALVMNVLAAARAHRLEEARSYFDEPKEITEAELAIGVDVLDKLGDFHVTGRRMDELACDFISGLATFDVKPVPPIGEIVTITLKTGDGGMGFMVRRTKGAQKIIHRGKALVAAEVLRASRSDPERAAAFAETLGWLVEPGARSRADLKSPATAPFAAAEIASIDPEQSKLVVAWLDKELERDDLTLDQLRLAAGAYTGAYARNPDARIAIARRFAEKSGEAYVHAAAWLESQVLREKGMLAEAQSATEAALGRFPDDDVLKAIRIRILAAQGEFERASKLTTSLNQKAYYASFGKPDEEAIDAAVRNAARPTTTSLNTLAEVEVARERWEEAMSAFLRELDLRSPRDLGDLMNDDFWVRGRLAEAIGLPDIAVAMYKRVVPPKFVDAADVYHLAAARLKALQP